MCNPYETGNNALNTPEPEPEPTTHSLVSDARVSFRQGALNPGSLILYKKKTLYMTTKRLVLFCRFQLDVIASEVWCLPEFLNNAS